MGTAVNTYYPCSICEKQRQSNRENNMRLTCELIPQKTQESLADLEPGVAAEMNSGIRWRDGNGFVLGILDGYPVIMNNNGSGFEPKESDYLITGRILGKISMKFEE